MGLNFSYFVKKSAFYIFFFSALIICSQPASSTPQWLTFKLNVNSDVRALDDIPACLECYKEFKVMRNNVLLGASAHSNNGVFGAEALLNLERMDTLAIYGHNSLGEQEIKNHDSFYEILLANFFINYGPFTLTTGRQFYGEPNTLRPFYGFYENYFFDIATSLDGVSLEFKKGMFSGKLLAARETDTNRIYAEKDYIYAANTQLELFKMWRLGAEYNYFMREEGYPIVGFPLSETEKGRHSFLSFFTDITFFDKTKISMEYVYHYGKIAEESYGTTVLTRHSKGSAFLISLNSEKETRMGHIESRFVYLHGPKPDRSHYNRKDNNHSYVYMGDIFGGISLIDRFTFYHNMGEGDFEGPPPVNGIQMYHLGATFNPKLPGNIRLSADFYSFASNVNLTWDQSSEHLGNELDLGLTFSPYYKMDIKLGYAVFMPGKLFNEMKREYIPFEMIYVTPEFKDVRQISLWINWRF